MFHNHHCATPGCEFNFGPCSCPKQKDHPTGNCPEHYTEEEKAFADEARAKIQESLERWGPK